MDKEYEFRIRAENKFGLSESLLSDKLSISADYSVPSAPQSVVVESVTAAIVTLTWQTPESDGNAPLIGYNVEKRQANSTRWIRLVYSRQIHNTI